MIPVLYRILLDTPFSQVVAVLFVLALVGYFAWSGWQGAAAEDGAGSKVAGGGKGGKADKQASVGGSDRLQRALLYGGIAAALGAFGLYYALPRDAFVPGKGEGIPIHTYGILVGSGFLAAISVAALLAKHEWPGDEGERKKNQILDLAGWVFLGAMVGSRLLFVIVNWKDYAGNPLKALSPTGGGLVFQGGLVGAALVAFFYARKHRIDFLRLSDIGLPVVSLGAAFGRLGCFSAGCCWGKVAPLAAKLAVHFPGKSVTNLFGGPSDTPSLAYQSQAIDKRYVIESTGEILHQMVPGAERISDWVASHGHTLGLYPTQLMDSVGNLTLFVAMMLLRQYRRFHGLIAGAWLMGYAVVRTSVELFRGDTERGTLHSLLKDLNLPTLADRVALEAWYNLSTGQFISLCMFAAGAVLVYQRGQDWSSRRKALLA